MSDAKRVRVSDVEFAQSLKNAVDNGLTLQDVADSLGMRMESVYQKYNAWRKKGVKIPHIPMKDSGPRQKKELDIESLSAMFE